MVNKRNRIIYASQSVFAEGQVLYRVQTFGSSTTFNTEDVFELGQLELTDVVDDSPEVAVTLDGNDYGSIYTMATLAKVPLTNLNHNIRQSDGTTFDGLVSGSINVSLGDLDAAAFSGLPAASGTGIANIVIKDSIGGSALKYYHGVQLIDFGRECGLSKGVDIYSPVQAECSLGTANEDIEATKYLSDVFINSVELNYQSEGISTENYAGETEQKVWLLNEARFVTWEEWHVGTGSLEISASTFAAKTYLQLALPVISTVATLEKGNLGFLKTNEVGRPSILMAFARGGGLTVGESKFVPIFDSADCIPSNALEYFIYNPATNRLSYFSNGLASTLAAALPAGRSNYLSGDRVFVVYAGNAFGEEAPVDRPAGADATVVVGKYFSPVPTRDVEDVGAVRQGQVEAYLVDPELVLNGALTGATIGANSITFSNTIASSVDLTRFVGLGFRVTSGPGAGGPAREIVSASNSISGNFNNGTITLGGASWSTLRLNESSTQSSTTTTVFVDSLCSVTSDYVGSSVTVLNPTSQTVTITGVNTLNNSLLVPTLSGAPTNASLVEVSVEPTTTSEFIVGDYELALRLQNVTFTANLTREALKELGHLNPYTRTLTLPIQFTVSIDTTASDLKNYAVFAGKSSKFEEGTLTDINITDLFAKDNLAVVIMVYQQNDTEAGGNGLDRKVNAPDMFGDEFFNDGIKGQYTSTDGSLTEYPLKTIIAQNLRITDEAYSLALGSNATQTFAFRGTNQLTAIRGRVGIEYVTKVIESQGE
jgi:hypothetical protein